MLWHKPITGFPIRTSPAHCSFDSSPKLIAVFHVLLHLLAPRHPPCTLCSLTHFLILKRGSNCYPLSIHFSKNYFLPLHFLPTTSFYYYTQGHGLRVPTFTAIIGGDERGRTANLCLARAALSQLSYIPYLTSFSEVVGLSGFEPLTFPLSGECSKPTEL